MIIPITTTACPEERRAANRHAKNLDIWNDPAYQAIAAKAIEGQPCHYCGRPATLAHHDNADSYGSKKEYYKPENMIPACGICHDQYRKGLEVCPVCKEKGEIHYMKRGSDCCYRHRAAEYQRRTRKHRGNNHPCQHHTGPQKCDIRHICPHSAQRANREVCPWFAERPEDPV